MFINLIVMQNIDLTLLNLTLQQLIELNTLESKENKLVENKGLPTSRMIFLFIVIQLMEMSTKSIKLTFKSLMEAVMLNIDQTPRSLMLQPLIEPNTLESQDNKLMVKKNLHINKITFLFTVIQRMEMNLKNIMLMLKNLMDAVMQNIDQIQQSLMLQPLIKLSILENKENKFKVSRNLPTSRMTFLFMIIQPMETSTRDTKLTISSL